MAIGEVENLNTLIFMKLVLISGSMNDTERRAEFEDLQLKKRPRFELEKYYEERKSLKANEVINLIFHDDNRIVHRCHPEFTHQIFDKELILTSSGNDVNSRYSIDIYVHSRVLTQQVVLSNIPDDEIDDIKCKLCKNLPDDTPFFKSFDNISFQSNKTKKDIAPIGVAITLANEITSLNDYEIYIADYKSHGEEILVTLKLLEKLAVWFIENADGVDFKDERWEVLLLYKKIAVNDAHASFEYQICGYMTLFAFSNPVFGTKLRICQVLVLHSEQRKGLGRFMLLQLYHYIVKHRDCQVQEITVEDPCEGFVRLRNVVDLEWFLINASRLLPVIESVFSFAVETVNNENPIIRLIKYTNEKYLANQCNKNFVDEIGKKLHLNDSQIKIVIECVALLAHKYHMVDDGKDLGDCMKMYKVQLKRSILKEQPEIKLIQPKEAILRALNKCTNERISSDEDLISNKYIVQLLKKHIDSIQIE